MPRTLFALREVSAFRKFTLISSAALAVTCGLFALTPLGGESYEWFLMGPPVALLAACVAACIVTLPAQLFARAVEWSNLGVGLMMCFLGSTRETGRGACLVVGCGVALLAMGRVGLREASRLGPAVPPALKGSLLLLMVLALADAQTFAFLGAVGFSGSLARMDPFVPSMIAATGLFTIGFVLLLRLSLLGLVVNVTTCVILMVVMLTRTDDGKPLGLIVGAVAGVHVLAAIPTFVMVAFKNRRISSRLTARGRAVVTPVVVVSSMLVAVITWIVRSQ